MWERVPPQTPCGSKGQTLSWNLTVRTFTCRAILLASNLSIELKSCLKELNRKEMALLLVEKVFEGPPPPQQKSMYLRVSLPIQKQATLLSHFWKAKFGDFFFFLSDSCPYSISVWKRNRQQLARKTKPTSYQSMTLKTGKTVRLMIVGFLNRVKPQELRNCLELKFFTAFHLISSQATAGGWLGILSRLL